MNAKKLTCFFGHCLLDVRFLLIEIQTKVDFHKHAAILSAAGSEVIDQTLPKIL